MYARHTHTHTRARERSAIQPNGKTNTGNIRKKLLPHFLLTLLSELESRLLTTKPKLKPYSSL